MLGDSNLKLELPYGVQEHDIDKAVVHENYDINDSLHQNDIGECVGGGEGDGGGGGDDYDGDL